jgi:hypothetical protein
LDLKATLKKCGIVVTKYDGGAGRNKETQQPIVWFSFGTEQERRYDSPALQMDQPFDQLFSAAALEQVHYGATDVATETRMVVYRGAQPDHHVTEIFDAKTMKNHVPKLEATEGDRYAFAALYLRCRTSRPGGGFLVDLAAKYMASASVSVRQIRGFARVRGGPCAQNGPVGGFCPRAPHPRTRAESGPSGASRTRVRSRNARSLELTQPERDSGSSGVTLVAVSESRDGASLRTVARQSKLLQSVIEKMTTAPDQQARFFQAMMRYNDAFQEACSLYDKGGRFTFDESMFLLARAGTQQAYRDLASALRLKFGGTVLEPVDNLVGDVKPSKVWSAIVDIEIIESDGSKKMVKAWTWHVDDVSAELLDVLDDLGERGKFVRRGHNEVWLLFGGDKGGSSFKFGFIVLNEDTPQSPLHIRWLSAMGGAKDTRKNLERTALRPPFCAMIDALKSFDVVHVVLAAGQPQDEEAVVSAGEKDYTVTHASALVQKGISVDSSQCLGVSEEVLGRKPSVAPDHCIESGHVCGMLAVYDGFAVGVAVVMRPAVLDSVAKEFIARKPCDDPDAALARAREVVVGLVDSFLGENQGGTFWIEARGSRILCVAPFRQPIKLCSSRSGFLERLSLDRTLTGDNEFLALCFGHAGSSARLPCYACESTKPQMKILGELGAWRTPAGCSACAAKNPLNFDRNKDISSEARAKIVAGTGADGRLYAKNDHKSINHDPLFDFFPQAEVAFGPLHWLLGTGARALDTAVAALARLDGTSAAAAEAATKVHVATAKRIELAAVVSAIDDDIKASEALLQKRDAALAAKSEALSVAEERVAKQKRTASKRTMAGLEGAKIAHSRAQDLVAEVKDQIRDLKKSKKPAQKAVSDADKAVGEAEKQRRAVGPLVAAFFQSLDQKGVHIQVWFQKLIGRHASKMFAKADEIWADVAAACPPEVSDAFIEVRDKQVAYWKDISTISGGILSAEIQPESTIDLVVAAAARYQLAAAELESVGREGEAEVNLKRHSLVHIVDRLRVRKTVGFWSESAFESWHAILNAIERRYASIVELLRRAACVRKAFLVRTHRGGLAAEAELRERKSVGPRAKKVKTD